MTDTQSTGSTHQKAALPVPKVVVGVDLSPSADKKKRGQSVQAVRRIASDGSQESVEYETDRPTVIAVAEVISEASDATMMEALSRNASEEDQEAFLAGMREVVEENDTETFDKVMRVSIEVAADGAIGKAAKKKLPLDDTDWAALWISKLDRSTVGRELMEHLAHMAALVDADNVPTESPIAQVVDWRRAYCYALGQSLATPWGMPHTPPKYVLSANLNGKRAAYYGKSPMLFQMFAHTPPIHGASSQGVEGMKELIKYLNGSPHLHGLMTYSMVFAGGLNELHWEARSVERKDDGTVIDGHVCLRIDDVQPSGAQCTSAIESHAAQPVVKALWDELETNVQAHDMDALGNEQFEESDEYTTWVSEKVERCRKIISVMQDERKKMEANHGARVAGLEQLCTNLRTEVASMQNREESIGALGEKVADAFKQDARLERASKETELERRKLRRDKRHAKANGGARIKAEEEDEEPPDPPLQPPQGMTHSEHWRMCADKIAWLRERLDEARSDAASALHELADKNREGGEAALGIMQERDDARARAAELEALVSTEKQRAYSAASRASNANRDLDMEKGRLAEANRKTIDDLERKLQDAQMQERTARAEAEQVLEKLQMIDRQLDGKDAEKEALNESIHEQERSIFRLKCAILAAGAKYDSRLDLLKEARMKHAEAEQALTEQRKEAKAKLGGVERSRTQAVARMEKLQGELAVSNAAIDDLRRELGEAQASAAASDAENALLAEKALLAENALLEAGGKKNKKKKGPVPADLVNSDESADAAPAPTDHSQPSALMRMQIELGEVTARMVRAEDAVSAKTEEVVALARDVVERTKEIDQLREQLLTQGGEIKRHHASKTDLQRRLKEAEVRALAPKDEAALALVAPPLVAPQGLASPGVELVIKQATEHLQLLSTLARRTDCAEMVAGQAHAQSQYQLLQTMVQPHAHAAYFSPNGKGSGGRPRNAGPY